jgi:hypothetical protein
MRIHRIAMVLTVAFLIGACEEAAGPPAKLDLLHVTEYVDKTAVVKAALQDAQWHRVRAQGELIWEFVEGSGAESVHRCALRAPLRETDFSETEKEGTFFEVKVALNEPCTPLTSPDAFAYGFISARLPDGKEIKDSEASWVPHAYGGEGRMNFPKHEPMLREQRKESAELDAAIGRLFADIARAAAVRPYEQLALGTPCPVGLTADGTVMRADRRVLAAIAEARRSGAKPKLPNHPQVEDLVKWLNGDRKLYTAVSKLAAQPRTHMVLIDVEKLQEPRVTDTGLGDSGREGKGSFDSGIFSGEVWVVDVASAKVVCRDRAMAANSQFVNDTIAYIHTSVNTDFIVQVGQAIRAVRQKIAPDLVRQRPE